MQYVALTLVCNNSYVEAMQPSIADTSTMLVFLLLTRYKLYCGLIKGNMKTLKIYSIVLMHIHLALKFGHKVANCVEFVSDGKNLITKE